MNYTTGSWVTFDWHVPEKVTNYVATLNGSVCNEFLEIHGNFRSQVFEIAIDDRDVIDAMTRFEQPKTAISALLKIGASATLATAVGYDINALRTGD